MSKQLIYKNEGGQIETYDLTDKKAEEIVKFLSSGNRATHFDWDGQSFMAKNARIKEESIPQVRKKKEYNLSNPIEREIVEEFEKELAKDWNNNPKWKFTDYLIKMNAIRIDSGINSEIIRNLQLYTELSKKWNSLGELRNQREKSKKLGEELVKIKPKLKTEIPEQKSNDGIKIEDLGF